jgi:ABC-type branched-subunit amino acid transport system substrate-binding protein
MTNKRIKGIVIAVISFLVVGAATWGLTLALDKVKNDTVASITGDKYVAIVMSKSDETFTIPDEFLTGFGSSAQLTTRGGSVVKVSYKDDHYLPGEAERVAEELVKDENCVMIIGNANSALTQITLNTLIRSKTRPAFILPIATASQLTAIAKSANYHAMLRMIPDNENQATQIKSFVAKNTPSQKVAILVDEENRAYSEDLAKKLSAKIRKNGGNIVYKRDYGDANRLVDDLEKLTSQGATPEILIFVGVSNNGLILIDELVQFKVNIPVIFTDGCTVEEIINKAAGMPNESYFLSAVTIKEGQKKATYEPIGSDAYKLTKTIVGGVADNSREAIRNYVSAHKEDIVINGGDAGDYQFGPDGDNFKMCFHIYKRVGDQLMIVTGY